MTIGLEGLGIVDTIYEDQEESYQSSAENTSNSGRLDNPRDRAWIVFENGDCTPPATNREESLRSIVWTWCQATGFPTSVTVHVMGCRFELHKFPLVSRSGYFKRELMEASEIRLSCPGGAETFELVAAFCYGSGISMGPSNVAALRCAAEFLEMTEEYCKGNLCKRAELYLKDVALKSWDDAIRVLRSCKDLHPLAGELHIDGACVEAASSIACFGFASSCDRGLDALGTPPTEFGFGGGPVEDNGDWVINGLLTLPFDYFGRVVESMRGRGMPEKILGRAIVLYVDMRVFDTMNEEIDKSEKTSVVESIVRLLPVEKDSMPVGFLFALLRCAFAWNASRECRCMLETRIAAQVDQATVTDFLVPLKSDNDDYDDDGGAEEEDEEGGGGGGGEVLALDLAEIDSMQQIVSLFMSQQTDLGDESDHTFFSEGNTSSHSSCSNPSVCNAAKVWDEYLIEIAACQRLSAEKFLDLVDTVPSFSRPAHDQLYRAIHIYLKTHPQISDTQRLNICKMLNCQKLSQEVCIHAVQNDFMPLRTIVQAMYIHQLQSMIQLHNTSRSNSLRIQTPGVNIGTNNNDGRRSNSLGRILKRDAAFRQADALKSDLEETNTRLTYLEEEIRCMKKNFNGSPDRADSAKQATDSSETEDFPKQTATSSNILPKKPCNLMANKGCGGGGVAQKFIKSLQKLSLGGFRSSKSKLKQSDNADKISSEARATGKKSAIPGVELDLATDDRSTRRHYRDNVNAVVDRCKPVRRRHFRGHSIS